VIVIDFMVQNSPGEADNLSGSQESMTNCLFLVDVSKHR